jgi:PIN domain nuclease of toxin-antitoxin system
MRLLLDTHAFIWWDSNPGMLSKRALKLCQDPTNEMLLSVASTWEMQIKLQLGKLTLSLPLRTIIESQREHNSLELLPVHLEHVLALDSLPNLHKDPFDRLLIAQANIEGAVLISQDAMFARYPVQVEW